MVPKAGASVCHRPDVTATAAACRGKQVLLHTSRLTVVGSKMHALQDLIDEHDPLRKHVQLLGQQLFINNFGLIAVTGTDTRTNTTHIFIMQPDFHPFFD